MADKRRTVAFFETRQQLAALQAYQERTGVPLQLVAVTPEADYGAEVRGLEYQVVEDFYSDPALMELGVRNYAKLEDFCLRLDQQLRVALADFRGGELVSTLPQFYYLKALFDALLHRSLTVTAVFAGTRPNTVISFAVPPPEQDITAFLLSNRLVSRLVPLVAHRLAVRSLVLPSRVGRIRSRYVAARVKQVPGLRAVLQFLRARRFLSKPASKRFSDAAARDHPILVYSAGDPFVRDVAAAWERTYPGGSINLRDVIRAGELTDGPKLDQIAMTVTRACRQGWRELSGDAEFRASFEIGLLDLYPLAAPIVEALLTGLASSVRAAEGLRRSLVRLPQSVLLMSGGGEYLGLAAHAAGRPAVVHQHGGAYGYMEGPIVEYSELQGASHFFCWGQGTAAYLKRPSPHLPRRRESRRAVPIAVGSPALDSLVERVRAPFRDTSSPSTCRTVLYVLTNLGGDRRYFNYHMYPDIWFWRLQQQVIETCSQHADVQLIVKRYPLEGVRADLVHNPVSDWLDDAKRTRCRVVHDRTFVELLSAADLFIIDWPATTLLEALTTTKPIITFADPRWVRLDPRAAALLSERVVLCESREEFLRNIDTVLSQEHWTRPRPVNDAFLCAYGTHCNDGRSAERAVAVLDRLARASPVGEDLCL